MAATSTKVMSHGTRTTPAGKPASKSMPLATPATIPTPTLKDTAESLVALELDLQEAKATGYRWHLFPHLTKTGRLGLVAIIYHPDHNLGVENLGDKDNPILVALIDGERASTVATRKTEPK